MRADIASAVRVLGTLSMWFSGMVFVLGLVHALLNGRRDDLGDPQSRGCHGMTNECLPGRGVLIVTWAVAAVSFVAGLAMWAIGGMG